MNARRESSHALPGGLPFALAAVGEQLCFISGMPALGEDGAYRPGTFEEEVASAWAHVERIAAAAGSSRQGRFPSDVESNYRPWWVVTGR